MINQSITFILCNILAKMVNTNCKSLGTLYLDKLNCRYSVLQGWPTFQFYAPILFTINLDALYQHPLPFSFSKRVVRDILF